jgi:hypothetical protein
MFRFPEYTIGNKCSGADAVGNIDCNPAKNVILGTQFLFIFIAYYDSIKKSRIGDKGGI